MTSDKIAYVRKHPPTLAVTHTWFALRKLIVMAEFEFSERDYDEEQEGDRTSWTVGEVKQLLSLYIRYKELLEGKHRSAVTEQKKERDMGFYHQLHQRWQERQQEDGGGGQRKRSEI